MVLLITKYNLSPKWLQLMILLIFYFILLKLHYLEQTIADCMIDGQRLNVLCDHTNDTTAQKLIVQHVQPFMSTDRLWLTEYINESYRAKDSLRYYYDAYQANEAKLAASEDSECLKRWYNCGAGCGACVRGFLDHCTIS